MRRGVDVPEFEAVSREWLEAQNYTTQKKKKEKKKKCAQDDRFSNKVLKHTVLEYELLTLLTQSVRWS